MQDVTSMSSLPAGILVVCIHAGPASADQSDFARLLASSDWSVRYQGAAGSDHCEQSCIRSH